MQISVADAAIEDFDGDLGATWVAARKVERRKWRMRVGCGITFGSGHGKRILSK
jgi:hypothetical protein